MNAENTTPEVLTTDTTPDLTDEQVETRAGVALHILKDAKAREFFFGRMGMIDSIESNVSMLAHAEDRIAGLYRMIGEAEHELARWKKIEKETFDSWSALLPYMLDANSQFADEVADGVSEIEYHQKQQQSGHSEAQQLGFTAL